MFSVKNLQIYRGNTSASSQGKDTAVIHTYKDLTATVANIKDTLPPYLGQGANQDSIAIGDHFVIVGSDTTFFTRILSLNPFTVSTDYFSGASGLSIGAPIAATDDNGAIIDGNTLHLEIADETHSGIMTHGTQDFGGEKNFHNNLFVTEPPNGIIVQKDTGSFGVALITNDATASPGFAIQDAAFPSQVQAFIYNRTGFTAPNPQVYILSGNNAGLILDNTDESVTIGNKIKADTIIEKITNNGVNIENVLLKDGGIAIGTLSPDASATIDINSTTQGFLLPRMTTIQMNAIASPAAGLQIFDTTTSQFMGYNGTAWVILG